MALSTPGRTRLLAVIGMVGPVTVLVSVLVSVAISPWFSFRHNALSDLGISDAAPLFNGGLIAGSIMGTLFALGYLMSLEPRRLFGAMGAIILAGSMVSLGMIGIFTEDKSGPHMFFSFAFFILLLASLLALGINLGRHGGCWTRSIPLVVTAVWGALVWAIPWGEGIAVPETLSALPGLLAVAYLAFTLLRGSSCRVGGGKGPAPGRKH